MEITRTFYAPDRATWRAWLQQHYRTEPDVWLVYYRKDTSRPRVSYNDAVEEALCFGWIDSTAKKLDEERFAQRFSPRRPRSGWSQPNRERLRRLVAQGLVADDVLPSVLPVLAEPFHAPADILAALRADAEGWRFFTSCSDAYQRIRIAFVETARPRPDEFGKRLDYLRRMNEAGKRFGHDIESFY